MRQLKITKQVTNRDALSLDKYLHDIGKEELISVEEEIELAKRIKQGDDEALNKLINANLRFVISVSKQYQNQGLSLPDLINEGNLGLIKAAHRFDETRGFKFISYAVWWIRQSILQALAEQARMIRLPLNKIGSLHKINRTYALLEQEYEREPTLEEVAKVLNITQEEVRESLKTQGKHISMDAPFIADEEGNMYDVMQSSDSLAPDEDMLGDSLAKDIQNALKTLPPREADILKLYFGLNGYPHYSLDEIADEFNLTRERVRQIKEKAIRRLKHTSRSKNLKSYLG
ncbi:MAG: RNA polymerase sigma factor RpoD/SigA [Bacteroidetes bacterium]|nr:RNA polymerase sigma factor RpoD/SigA [Bacteroidota bacterium]